MKVRLTLSIDKRRIKKIKRYAKYEGITVSKFLEQRIDLITDEESGEKNIPVRTQKNNLNKL